jgi:hypothetical protein
MALGTAVIVGVGPGLGLEPARIFGNAGLDAFAAGLLSLLLPGQTG